MIILNIHTSSKQLINNIRDHLHINIATITNTIKQILTPMKIILNKHIAKIIDIKIVQIKQTIVIITPQQHHLSAKLSLGGINLHLFMRNRSLCFCKFTKVYYSKHEEVVGAAIFYFKDVARNCYVEHGKDLEFHWGGELVDYWSWNSHRQISIKTRLSNSRKFQKPIFWNSFNALTFQENSSREFISFMFFNWV